MILLTNVTPMNLIFNKESDRFSELSPTLTRTLQGQLCDSRELPTLLSSGFSLNTEKNNCFEAHARNYV